MEIEPPIKKVTRRVKKKQPVKEDEEEQIAEKKALPNDLTLPDEFPENGPSLVTSIPDFLSILLSFFIVGHRYVALQELDNGTIVPSFFTLLEKVEDACEMVCQFVKHQNTRDEQGQIHVQPLWDEPWSKKTIGNNVVWNCIPFDENRDYHYTVKS